MVLSILLKPPIKLIHVTNKVILSARCKYYVDKLLLGVNNVTKRTNIPWDAKLKPVPFGGGGGE
jgi:hypothetical protein